MRWGTSIVLAVLVVLILAAALVQFVFQARIDAVFVHETAGDQGRSLPAR